MARHYVPLALAAAVAACMAPGLPQAQESSRYTSLKSSACRKPAPALQAHFHKRGLTAEECAAPGGLKVYAVSSDARSWLEIEMNRTLWSTEAVVVHQQNSFGHFPNLGAEQIEWQLADGRPVAVIFRIAAQDPQQPEKNTSRLFVLRLAEGAALFCGAVKTNTEARAAAASGNCSERLSAHALP